MFRFLLILVVAVLIGAFVTKPSEGDINLMLRERLAAEIENGAGLDASDPGAQLVLGLCKSNRAACIDLLSQFVRVGYEDEILYARLDVTLPGKSRRSCIAAFTTVACPGFLQD